ncbi:hypothetical protein [Cryptosporangium aurantiacum]|uniref:Uncharacterized protein n=1 Tax=Cryptosporangium aurantiacum TaxID=134849 RepID=A0A1M7IE03_9ACTN|nr:hypothetical protein [Cryptosporangium aurantiacum]SHM38905.1 hypothetical protein SAMN05443668_101466 [Cryptosporangium aurantiacum]
MSLLPGKTAGGPLLRTVALSCVIVLVLAVAGCTADGDEDPTAPRSFRDCGEIACTGEIDGARYQIRLPEVWNGTLLLYSHEFRSADPFPPAFEEPRTDAPVAGDNGAANRLLEAGYALAGSSWSRNGYALREGVQAGQQLYEFFRTTVGEPARTYVWGESLGGVVTELLAEREDWVDAALPMCSTLAGTNPNFDLALDIAFAFKTLIYPEMKLTGFASYAEAKATWTEMRRRATAALSGGADQLGRLMLVSALGNQVWKSRDHDDATIESRIDAGMDILFEVMGYATIVRYDLEQRVGGNPSTNVTAQYGQRISAKEKEEMAFIDPDGLDGLLAELEAAPRITANPAARKAADALGDPTGKLRVPTLTVHTGYDATAIVQNETVFANRALRTTGRSGDLMQIYTTPPPKYTGKGAPYGAGHCNFTTDERVGAISNLDRWARTGTRPSLVDIGITMRGTSKATGFDPVFVPGQWPAEREVQ